MLGLTFIRPGNADILRDVSRFVAANLTDQRRRAGLSEDQLATAVGCSREQIIDMESGVIRPSIISLARIVGALGCDVTDLLDEDDWFMLDDERPSDLGQAMDERITTEAARLPAPTPERAARMSAVLFPRKLA